MNLIQEYREVEAKSRDRSKARMERQYKTVKPDATQEEIRYMIESDQGAQIFASAVSPIKSKELSAFRPKAERIYIMGYLVTVRAT